MTQHQKNKQPDQKMGRRTEETFFQRGNVDGQQAGEITFNITDHQGNANQNHNEISPHDCQNDYYEKVYQ